MSDDRRLGHVTVLAGERGGRYPDGNSLLVAGGEETVIIDPSLTVVARRGRLPRVDRVLVGHCHEDHIAGNHLFPDAPAREERLVEYLREPRTIAEIVAHRFVYRPRDDVLWAEPVERRSMVQHLERLCRAGRVAEVEPGRFLATRRR